MNGPANPSRTSWVRWAVRVSMTFLAAGVFSALSQTRWPVVVSSLSPLTVVASTLATRAIVSTAWLGFVVGAIVMIRRRWFCRWLCPTGLCADTAAALGRRLGRRCPRMPHVGAGIAALTLGGACAGYPVLLWLDPLAIFASAFHAVNPATAAAGCTAAAGLAVVLVLSLLFPGIWCLRLCPLGALQDLVRGRVGRACEPHQPCSSASPEMVGLASSTHPTVTSPSGTDRRLLLAGLAGAAWAIAAKKFGVTANRPLRPPGSRDEATFTGLCIRCGNCVRACPSRILRPDLGDHGLAGLLAPTVSFDHDYCREKCVRCTEVCPSGALQPLPPSAKPQAVLGLATVDMNHCLLGDDHDCSACRGACPYDAITLVFSETDYTLTPVVAAAHCPGCGACEAACPTTPKAIVVRKAERRTNGRGKMNK